MDRPRLRPLEAFPVDDQGQKLLALRDPSGIAEGVARLPPLAVAILQLCDGDSTREEICTEFGRRYGRPLERAALDRLLAQLDDALLLDTERFRQHSARVFAEFARAPVRPAYHAGKSYPSDPAELRSWLDSFSAPPNGPGPLGEQRGALPRALIAPHIDFSRGGPAYAWAYRALAEAAEPPELIVLFGTSHASGERIFTLTRKSYDTPLGRIETDVSVVEALETALREKLGPEAANGLFVDEHLHRGEHSLELQMVWLRHVLGERADAVRIVPILVGSMRSWIDEPRDPATSPEVALVLSELSHIVEGKRLLVIASADLAHVGPRFGDGAPLDAEDRASLERRDQVTLAPVLRGDAAAWFAELAREKDRRNVCGLSPIYSMLQLLSKRASGEAQPVIGRQVAYGQCPADERSTSVVSIASIVFP